MQWPSFKGEGHIGGANGNELGARNKDKRAMLMSQEAIETAQAMARECMASNYQNCVD